MALSYNSELRMAPIYIPAAPSSTTLAGIITTGAAAVNGQVMPTLAGAGAPGLTQGWWDFYALGADCFVVFGPTSGANVATTACAPILTTQGAVPFFINGDRAFVSAITAGGAGTLRWVPSSR